MARAGTLVERLSGRRVGVVLSAGYFGFFGHVGFLQALEDAGVSVDCYGGTSAGALVGAMAASGKSPRQILDRLMALRRDDFWDPDPLGALGGLRGHGATGLLKGARFRALLERELPARFEDLEHRCLIVATNLTRNQPQAFHSGPLPSRVHASCAYPGMFRATEVDGELFWDGGLVDKAPAVALARAFRPDVLLVHYLPSRGGAGPAGFAAYPKAMAGAIAALRQDHFKLQVELLRSAGTQVDIVSTELPALGPSRLGQGAEVAAEARRKVAESLASSFAAAM